MFSGVVVGMFEVEYGSAGTPEMEVVMGKISALRSGDFMTHLMPGIHPLLNRRYRCHINSYNIIVRYKGYIDEINEFLMMLMSMIIIVVSSWVSRGAGFLSCLAHHVPRVLAYSGQIHPRSTLLSALSLRLRVVG